MRTLSSRTAYRNAVLALATLLAGGCRSMILDDLIFLPDPTFTPPPRGVEQRTFAAADGTSLSAFYAPPPHDRAPVLLWSHGNAGNVSSRAPILVALAARGLGVFAFDYRGYGRSEGRPSEDGVRLDAEAAYQALRAEGIAAGRIVAFGESIGGAVAVDLAHRRPCAALIVLSTFTTLNDVARVHYGFLAGILSKRFPSVERVAEIDCPLLAIHGDRDEIVPHALGEALFAAAREPKRWLTVRGARHNDVFERPEVLTAIAEFAERAVADRFDADGAPDPGGAGDARRIPSSMGERPRGRTG